MRLIDLLNVIGDYEEVDIYYHGETNMHIYDTDTAIGAIRQLTMYHECIITSVESYPSMFGDDSHISIGIKEEGF